MKRAAVLFLSFVTLFSISACHSTQYLIPGFYNKTQNHKKIAVLPFEMVYTGKMPAGITTADLQHLNHAEAVAFQKSLFSALSAEKNKDKKSIRVDIQLTDSTNKLLAEAGVRLDTISIKKPEELAKLLGVDAVVYSKVEKERFLSDLESFDIHISEQVLDKLKKENLGALGAMPDLPGNASRTYNIKAECTLINAADGLLLWKHIINTDTDWQQPANAAINELNIHFSKKFPYRSNKYSN